MSKYEYKPKNGQRPDIYDAKELVHQYVGEHLDVTDSFMLSDDDIYCVWWCYILGGWKCLMSTTIHDGMYYEVTYNKDANEIYLDAYKKFENRGYKVG